MLLEKYSMVWWAVVVGGWQSPSYRRNRAGSVEAGMNDATKHTRSAGVAGHYVLF